jgi:hypothetical protein
MFGLDFAAWVQRSGYRRDQKGILRRYHREAKNWELHLSKTKDCILNFIEGKTGRVAVLGSGWLLDVPVDALKKQFDEIVCYDLLHPKNIVKQYADNQKFSFIERDVTGGLSDWALQQPVYEGNALSVVPEFGGFFEANDFDAVISVNLLSQLDGLAVDYLTDEKNYPLAELLLMSQSVQQQHIDSLPKGKTLLITDTVEFAFDEISEIERKLIHAQLPHSFDTWIWTFDTRGLYIAGKEVNMKVEAFLL